MHPHSTSRFYNELCELPAITRAQVLSKLEEVPGAELFRQALATFWSNHAES